LPAGPLLPSNPQTAGAAPPQSSTPSFLLNEQRILENHLAALDRSEAQALQALSAGKHALADAESEGNAQAAAVAQQAIDVANQVLGNIRNEQLFEETRLARVKHALAWPPSDVPVGVPTLALGDVRKRTSGGDIPFLSGPVQPGDEIVVGAGSYIEILAPDGETISLGPNADFIYLGGKDKSASELMTGILRVVGRAEIEAAKTEMRLITHFALLAVRGTEYVVEATDNGSTFTVLEGVVDVTPKGSSNAITVHAGEQLRVTRDGAVEGPTVFDTKQVARWWAQ
jgi:hypothetical protein